MYDMLRKAGCPHDAIILHPEETDSTYLADRVRSMFENRPVIVRIPRSRISQAQDDGDSWGTVLEQDAGEYWVDQLDSSQENSAVILAIFCGSGSTCSSLGRLLEHFNIVPFGYICLVDYDPRSGETIGAGIPKFSLYEWYNPRELLEVTS